MCLKRKTGSVILTWGSCDASQIEIEHGQFTENYVI